MCEYILGAFLIAGALIAYVNYITKKSGRVSDSKKYGPPSDKE